MSNLETLESTISGLRAFSASLQPVHDIPSHLYGVRGFVDYRPNEGSVEISFFFRPRFLIITFKDDMPRHRAKMRMDFAMSLDEFNEANHEELRAYMLNEVFSVTADNIRALPGVEKVEPIFNLKRSLAGATQVIRWESVKME